jgi:hypothetical protein
MRYVFAVLMMLVVVSGGLFAQDTTALEPVDVCTEEETQVFVDSVMELIQTPAEGGLFEQLDMLQDAIETHRWKCSGMVMSGEPEAGKAVVVLGPISIPDGIYRVSLTTDEFFILGATELSGDCRLHFAASDGDASAGMEQIYEYDDDCTMLLEIEAEAPWEIRFVQVSAGS